MPDKNVIDVDFFTRCRHLDKCFEELRDFFNESKQNCFNFVNANGIILWNHYRESVEELINKCDLSGPPVMAVREAGNRYSDLCKKIEKILVEAQSHIDDYPSCKENFKSGPEPDFDIWHYAAKPPEITLIVPIGCEDCYYETGCYLARESGIKYYNSFYWDGGRDTVKEMGMRLTDLCWEDERRERDDKIDNDNSVGVELFQEIFEETVHIYRRIDYEVKSLFEQYLTTPCDENARAAYQTTEDEEETGEGKKVVHVTQIFNAPVGQVIGNANNVETTKE